MLGIMMPTFCCLITRMSGFVTIQYNSLIFQISNTYLNF